MKKMNNIKTFEKFTKTLEKYIFKGKECSFADAKSKIIEEIKKIMYEFDLENFVIANERGDYLFEDFYRNGNDIYFEYEQYTGKKSNRFKKRIEDVDPYILLLAWEDIEESHRLDPEYLLTYCITNIKTFKTILRKIKKTIDFRDIFDNFYDNSMEKELLKPDFQELLLKTHPEAIESFIETNTDFLPSIVNKFPNLKDRIDVAMAMRVSKKFNM